MKISVIHGPNLNMLGRRDKSIYGGKTLKEIDALIKKEAKTSGIDVITFQSNHEGALVDFVQEQAGTADGMIINPGALTHYGFSLLDALVDSRLPVIEVHLSNIYRREEWRSESIFAPIAEGQICGLGWRGYVAALQILVGKLKAKPSR